MKIRFVFKNILIRVEGLNQSNGYRCGKKSAGVNDIRTINWP